jgi:hypothetical protein
LDFAKREILNLKYLTRWNLRRLGLTGDIFIFSFNGGSPLWRSGTAVRISFVNDNIQNKRYCNKLRLKCKLPSSGRQGTRETHSYVRQIHYYKYEYSVLLVSLMTAFKPKHVEGNFTTYPILIDDCYPYLYGITVKYPVRTAQ